METTAPKKLTAKGLKMIPGTINRGTKLIRTVPIAIIRFEEINPTPYRTKIFKLLLGVFEIPKLQKKKIALSSHGITV